MGTWIIRTNNQGHAFLELQEVYNFLAQVGGGLIFHWGLKKKQKKKPL